jgi:hypothetical protein
MLDVNNVNLQHLTKVIEKLKNLKTMSVRWTSIEKNGRRKAKYFKTNALVPKKAVLRKGEGATVAASHLPPLSWLVRASFCGQDGQRLHGNNFTGRPHKILQMSYLRRESKRRRFRQIQRCR